MIRLGLFGAPTLTGPDDESIRVVLRQPKRLAVMSYLALAGTSGFRNRDALLLLFWPDVSSRRARSALNQAIHFLRRSLGPSAITSRGPNELGLRDDIVWCDAVAFQRAVARGELEEALQLYRGDLLPAFGVDAGPDFEHWLDGERIHYRRIASEAAWVLATKAEAEGDFRSAADLGRRCMELSHHDEGVVRGVLRLLVRAGDSAGALQIYEAFSARMASEYSAHPSAETAQLAATLRASCPPPPQALQTDDIMTEGQLRSAAPATVAAVEPEGRLTRVGVAIPSSPSRLTGPVSNPKTNPVRWVLALLGAAFVVGGFLAEADRLAGSRSSYADANTRATITVEPFRGAGMANNFGRVLQDAVTDQLTKSRSFVVLNGSTSAPRTEQVVGQAVGPRFTVNGSLVQALGRLRTTIRISNTGDGTTIQTATLDHGVSESADLADTLALEVSSLVRVAIGKEIRFLKRGASTESKDVARLVREAETSRDLADEFDKRGDFAATAVALNHADSSWHAIEQIEPAWGEPWIARALVLQRLAGLYGTPPLHDSIKVSQLLASGTRDAEHAVSLDSEDASAAQALGTLSYWYWLLVPVPRDSAEKLLAIAEHNLRVAVALDAGRAEAWSLLSASLYAQADYVDAYVAANRAYKADAYLDDPQEILDGLFLNAYEIGDYSSAARWCAELGRRAAHEWLGARCTLELLAWHDRPNRRSVPLAWRIADTHDEQPSVDRVIRAQLHMLVATVIARNGMRDSAEAVIRDTRAHNVGDPELLPLEADARIAMGERHRASMLLTEYFAAKPRDRLGVVRSRRFAALGALERRFASLTMATTAPVPVAGLHEHSASR